jgi:phage baseplate assembly protein W
MGSYSFKSVGQTPTSAQNNQVSSSPLPVGIKTPLELGGSDGLLVMNYDLETQLADNLSNLLQTNWGERLGHYFFGANLKPLTVDFNSQTDFDNEAIARIKTAVTTWMPFIDLEDFVSEVDRLENKKIGIIKIAITYNIPGLNVYGKKIQIVLYVI